MEQLDRLLELSPGAVKPGNPLEGVFFEHSAVAAGHGLAGGPDSTAASEKSFWSLVASIGSPVTRSRPWK